MKGHTIFLQRSINTDSVKISDGALKHPLFGERNDVILRRKITRKGNTMNNLVDKDFEVCIFKILVIGSF